MLDDLGYLPRLDEAGLGIARRRYVVTDPASLSFDRHQPYRLVAEWLEHVRGERTLDVLEVGGRMGRLRRFLPRDRVVLVDVEPSEEPGLVLGDGAALPFRSRSFDVVAAFDTLEHVPPARRAAFVSECARVSKGWIFLAGPYRAPEVDEAELQACVAQELGVAHRSPVVPRHDALPEQAAVEEALRGAGWRVASIGGGNMERWLAQQSTEMEMDGAPAQPRLVGTLRAHTHAAPLVRSVVCAAFGNAPLSDGAKLAADLANPRPTTKVV